MPAESTTLAAPEVLTDVFDVLLIDDDEGIRGVLCEILRRNNYTFQVAGNGKDALALLLRKTYRLVVTDIHMPGMDGLELIMSYTARNPQALILAISGGCRGQFAMSSLKPAKLLGSRRTLAKPFGVMDFIKVVREMLGENCAAKSEG
jgi:DNA-binding NtrC family response regulator